MKYLNVVSCTLLLVLIACKKDNKDQVILSGVYKPQQIIQSIYQPTMYTRNGKITDNTVISSYLARSGMSHYFNLTSLPFDAPVPVLDFLGTGLVKVTLPDITGTATVHAEITNRSNSEMTIRHLDSLLRIRQFDSCGFISDFVQGFDKISDCHPSGSVTVCKYRPFFKLYFENGVPYQQILNYVVSNRFQGLAFPGQPPQDVYCYRASTVYDNFDPAVVIHFGPRDTIVVQSFKVKLVKQ